MMHIAYNALAQISQDSYSASCLPLIHDKNSLFNGRDIEYCELVRCGTRPDLLLMKLYNVNFDGAPSIDGGNCYLQEWLADGPKFHYRCELDYQESMTVTLKGEQSDNRVYAKAIHNGDIRPNFYVTIDDHAGERNARCTKNDRLPWISSNRDKIHLDVVSTKGELQIKTNHQRIPQSKHSKRQSHR